MVCDNTFENIFQQEVDVFEYQYPDAHILRINKIQGQPFAVSEIVDRVTKYMEED